MGNGHCIMNAHCWYCKDQLTKSYFMRKSYNSLVSEIIEVCPECHHYYTYAEPKILKEYKERRDIKE